jgi:hypothetical protein
VTDYVLKFDARQRILLITFGKILTESSFMNCYCDVQRFAAGVGGCAGITDLTEVEHFLLSIKFLRTVAEAPPAIPPGTIRVVVAPDRLAFGLSRIFQLFRDGMRGELQVVRTLDEAFAKLRVQAAEFAAVEI